MTRRDIEEVKTLLDLKREYIKDKNKHKAQVEALQEQLNKKLLQLRSEEITLQKYNEVGMKVSNYKDQKEKVAVIRLEVLELKNKIKRLENESI